MKTSPEKQQEKSKDLVSTLKFWSVVLPFIVLWQGIHYFQALSASTTYRQDCSKATASRGFYSGTAPCYYVAANATLINYRDVRGRTQSQDISIAYNGKVSEIEVDHDPIQVSPTVADPRLSEQSVNGACEIEVWHNQIVLIIIRSGDRIQARENPETQGSTFFGVLFVAMVGITISIWAYLLRHRSK